MPSVVVLTMLFIQTLVGRWDVGHCLGFTKFSFHV